MATTPTPTPITPPTSNDLAQLRQDAVAASTPAAPPPETPPTPAVVEAAPVVPATPEPFQLTETPEGVEIRLETGAVYKGKTWQEAVAQVAKGKVESDKTIRQMRTAPPPAPAPEAAPEAAPEPETKEQREARMWAVSQLATSVGMKPEQLLEFMAALPQVVQTTQQTQQSNLAAAFMQVAPEFPNTQEASDALVSVAEELGIRPTADGLRAAHLLAMSRGLYKPIVPTQPAVQRPAPAPMLNPSSPVPASGAPTDADLRTMPLAQLRELAIKGGQ